MGDRKGFTLVELMIVVVVLGILIAIGIPNFALMQNRAREASVKANGHSAQVAVENYASLTSGAYPPAASAQADIEANLPGGNAFENPFAGGGGLTVNAGADEGMVDYLDPAAVAPNTYQLNCYGTNDALILSLSNG